MAPLPWADRLVLAGVVREVENRRMRNPLVPDPQCGRHDDSTPKADPREWKEAWMHKAKKKGEQPKREHRGTHLANYGSSDRDCTHDRTPASVESTTVPASALLTSRMSAQHRG